MNMNPRTAAHSETLTHHQRTLLLWEAMGAEPVDPEPARVERRRQLRFLVPQRSCRLVRARGRERPISVVIHDVSTGGACLLSPKRLAVDQRARLLPPSDATSEMHAVAIRVVSCRRSSGRYRVGVAFLRPEE